MIADLVARLIASGTPPDVAATVVAEAFAAGATAIIPRNSADLSAERRREKDRIRKQNAKNNPQNSSENNGIPQNSKSASLSIQIDHSEIKGSKREANRGNRLPEDWQPHPVDWTLATELIGDDRSRGEIAKFKDHWKQQPGAKGVKLDWGAAWRNWIRRAAEYGGNRNGNATGAGANSASNQSGSATIFAGVAAATERRARERNAAGQHRPAPPNDHSAERTDPEFFGTR